jgi:hypothetical protein
MMSKRRRLCAAHRRQYIAHRSRRRELHRRIAKPQPPRPQPHLIDRFLTRNIGDIEPAPRQIGRCLQQQRRLPDPRITAQQGRRSRNQPAAQSAVKFGYPGRSPIGQLDVAIEPDQPDIAPAILQMMLQLEYGRARLFNQAVPRTAILTLPLPARCHGAAFLTDKSFFGFRHAQMCIRTYKERNQVIGRYVYENDTNAAALRGLKATQVTGRIPPTVTRVTLRM